jgi:hypothetical protein
MAARSRFECQSCAPGLSELGHRLFAAGTEAVRWRDDRSVASRSVSGPPIAPAVSTPILNLVIAKSLRFLTFAGKDTPAGILELGRSRASLPHFAELAVTTDWDYMPVGDEMLTTPRRRLASASDRSARHGRQFPYHEST